MSEQISRLTKALEDSYRIESKLGQGGMAVVYLAEDLRHERLVALKVLKPELAAVVGAERFLVEIKTTANLRHPHILPLFDSGDAGGLLYYVMPYVAGETLRERIDREKQLPVDEAVAIAAAVAHALQHAHDHGVVHRDIKPSNILLQDGQPVVSDFGIALAVDLAAGSRLTKTGLSVGTPFYMSPEQATGDHQLGPPTDTYALGVVLYEMLTGQPPYTGATAQAVLARIIEGAPVSPTDLRKSVPRNVEGAIRQALEQLPADRFRSVNAFARALTDSSFRYQDVYGDSSAVAKRKFWKYVSIALMALVAGLMIALVAASRRGPESRIVRVPVALPEGNALARVGSPSVALSPDGTRLVYTGSSNGSQMLLLWQMDRLDPEPIPGTTGGHDPFFSPDGTAVGFFAGTKLRTVSLDDGRSLTLADVPTSRGGTWSDDGYIYYARGTIGGLLRVRATGGSAPEAVTESLTSHRWPTVLPGGAGVLVGTYSGDAASAGVAVIPPGDTARVLIERGMMPQYSPTGHIVFVTLDGAVQAAPINLKTLEVTGPAFTVFEGVSVDLSTVGADLSLAEDGTLAYVAGSSIFELVQVDRSGGEEVLSGDVLGLEAIRASPDGQHLAMSFQERAGMAVMVHDIGSSAERRLTFEGTARYPSWHPDGDRLVFSMRTPKTIGVDLYEVPADGSKPATPVYVAPFDQYEGEWTLQGRELAIRETNLGGRDIVRLVLGEDSVRALLATSFNERSIAVSPDGQLIAYVSDESGVDEVYVRDYPGPGGQVKVSVNGGTEPRWRRDGRELYYRSSRGFIAVPIRLEPAFIYDQEHVLFPDVYAANNDHAEYDVDPTGQFFYVSRAVTSRTDAVLVFNWFDALRLADPAKQSPVY